MYNGLDTIPACNGWTERRTSCHGIVRAMHERRAVKKRYNIQLCLRRPTNRKSYMVYGAIINDLEQPLTQFSRSRYSLTLNIS